MRLVRIGAQVRSLRQRRQIRIRIIRLAGGRFLALLVKLQNRIRAEFKFHFFFQLHDRRHEKFQREDLLRGESLFLPQLRIL